jgi:hypothetical protein
MFVVMCALFTCGRCYGAATLTICTNINLIERSWPEGGCVSLGNVATTVMDLTGYHVNVAQAYPLSSSRNVCLDVKCMQHAKDSGVVKSVQGPASQATQKKIPTVSRTVFGAAPLFCQGRAKPAPWAEGQKLKIRA